MTRNEDSSALALCDAAGCLGVSVRTVYQWLDTGKLSAASRRPLTVSRRSVERIKRWRDHERGKQV